ncbi:MAG: SrfA family protein [Myxococcota bacterium]|nr:SrfA family protein [Myxococcota bacterium]
MSGPSDRTLLLSESRYRFRSLGVRERAVFDWYPQLEALLRRRLGERQAGFFAEPVADTTGERIDWYAASAGDAVPLGSLDGPDAARAEGRVAELLDELRALAAELSGSAREEEQVAGEILESALFFPERDHVFLVGGQPVVVFWGFAPPGREPPHTPLFRRGGAPPPAAAPPPREARRWPAWLAALPLLLLVPLGWLTLCSDERPVALEALPPGGDDPLAPLLERRRALRRALEIERERYAARLASCEPPRFAVGSRRIARPGAVASPAFGRDRVGPVASPALPIERRPSGTDGIDAVDAALGAGIAPAEGGPSGPDVPEIAAVDAAAPAESGAGPLDPGAPAEPPGGVSGFGEEASERPGIGDEAAGGLPSQDGVVPEGSDPALAFGGPQPGESQGESGEPGGGEPLAIPPDAQPGGDPSFLQGRWRSQTKLAQDGSSGGRVQMDFEFDGRGRGRVSVTQEDGTVCQAPARARVGGDGRLRIQADEGARCPDGSRYSRVEVVCETGRASAADCYADQEEGARFPLEMRR